MVIMTKLLFLLVMTSTPLLAQTVKEICPESRMIREPRKISDIVSNFPSDLMCSVGSDATVDELTGDIISSLYQAQGKARQEAGGQDPALYRVYEVAGENNSLTKPLGDLASLIQNYRLKKTPPTDPEVVGMIKAAEEFKKGVSAFEAKTIDINQLKKLENTYIEAVKSTMRKTPEGRKALKCYESPSKTVADRLPGGKMAPVRLTTVVNLENNSPKETQFGGSFAAVCEHTSPASYKTELSLDPYNIDPMHMPYELTHEMTHSCDSQELMDDSYRVKKAGDLAEAVSEKLRPVLGKLEVTSLSAIPKIRFFASWVKKVPRDPAPAEEFEETRKLIEQSNISVAEVEELYTNLSSNTKLRSELQEAEKQQAFNNMKSEIKGFGAALNSFKELAKLDKSYCALTEYSVFNLGPRVYSRSDFFMTLEEGEIVDEVAMLYALKNKLMPTSYFFKMKARVPGEKPKPQVSVLDQIELDSAGRPIYTDEFMKFLADSGIKLKR